MNVTNEKDINRCFVRRHLVRPPGTDKQAEAWAHALPDATTRLATVSKKHRQVTLVFPWGHVKAPMADFEREWVALDEWLAPRAAGVADSAAVEDRVRLVERAEKAEEMVRVLKRELFWASLHAM